MTYIYSLNDPETGEARYVGKATDLWVRLRQHISKSRGLRTHRDYWIQSLLSRGLVPTIHPLEGVSEDAWEAAEQAHILRLRQSGARLTNHTDGGEGCRHWAGKNFSPEHREKIAASRRGVKRAPFTRRAPSAETRLKISETKRMKGPLVTV